jgi:hypothetical protein
MRAIGALLLRKDEKTPGLPLVPETVDATRTDDERTVRCRACEHPITKRSARLEVDGAHVHERANPAGFLYRIGCFRHAPGCGATGAPSTFFSWFAGYAWQLALCAGCGVHLGWAFRSSERSFFGLILERLRDE